MGATPFDIIPIRLPSGTKAFVNLPRPFTVEDAAHFMLFLAEYIEQAQAEEKGKDAP